MITENAAPKTLLVLAALATISQFALESTLGREIRLRTILDESQVVRPGAFQPPKFGTGSPGTGPAELIVDTETGDYTFDMEIDGITPEIIDNTVGPNLTGLHVHTGTPDVRGPIIIDAHHFAREASPDTNGLTATENGFRVHVEGTLAQQQGALDTGFTPDQVIDFLQTEQVFVAVHTDTNDLFRTGAIRGNFQIVPQTIRLRTTLDESQVVRPDAFQPPRFGTGSPGMGPCEISIDTTTGDFVFDLMIEGITPDIIDNTVGPNLTGLHVHTGTPDVRGPIILDVHHFGREILPDTNGLAAIENGFMLHVNGTLAQQQGALDTGFTPTQMIDFLRTETVFVAVHTNTNDLFRTGAIRGNFKIVPETIRLFARLDESQVVRPEAFQPPKFGTGSPGTGIAELVVNPVNGRYVFDIDIDGIDPDIVDNTVGANFTGLHVHRGTPDMRGPIILDFHHFARISSPETNGLIPTDDGFRLHVEGRLTQFQGDEDIGSSTPEIVDFLRTGDVFVAVHTTTNDLFRTGAIRGNFRIFQTNDFIRSDVNADGIVDLTDPIVALEAFFLGKGDIECEDAADANDDGQLDISDPISSLFHQFLGDPIPFPGARSCGFDATDDRLECAKFEECE